MNRAQLLFFCVLVAAIGAGGHASAQTTPAHRAALLVHYGEGRVETYCARFSESAISGEQLLRRVGLTTRMEATSMGYAVCMIGSQGCRHPAEACFCRCQSLGADCTFWNYLQQRDGAWRTVPAGVSAPIIVDGSIFAWSWSAGDGENVSVRLPLVDLDAVCMTPAAAPTQPPTVAAPTAAPSIVPTAAAPATAPTQPPTVAAPTVVPTVATPTTAPTQPPTVAAPTAAPSVVPTVPAPTTAPTQPPTAAATDDASTQGLIPFVATAAVLLASIWWMRRRRGAP
jgi:hypothetical protein